MLLPILFLFKTKISDYFKYSDKLEGFLLPLSAKTIYFNNV